MGDPTPTQRVVRWLAALEQALASGDAPAVAALFEADGFWRDMVAFTWSIKTMEGRDAIAAMLDATLDDVRPGTFRIEGEAREADGITEATFTFETKVAEAGAICG